MRAKTLLKEVLEYWFLCIFSVSIFKISSSLNMNFEGTHKLSQIHHWLIRSFYERLSFHYILYELCWINPILDLFTNRDILLLRSMTNQDEINIWKVLWINIIPAIKKCPKIQISIIFQLNTLNSLIMWKYSLDRFQV